MLAPALRGVQPLWYIKFGGRPERIPRGGRPAQPHHGAGDELARAELGGQVEDPEEDVVDVGVAAWHYVGVKAAPEGRRMGHAGAIVEGGSGTHASKIKAMREAGITVVENLSEIGEAVAKSRRPLAA
mgnify:CR=1 FL=1